MEIKSLGDDEEESGRRRRDCMRFCMRDKRFKSFTIGEWK